MSNLPSPPGNRPLEQLKVAELREQLKKRGLSLKGVKKDLFERLDEVIKQEQQEGVVHKEDEEGASKIDAADESEDFEGDVDTLDGVKEEACKGQDVSETQDITSVCPNSDSPNASVLPTKGTTPFQESQALSVVSAPDGVPGVSEDREQCSTAGILETNNNVLFVDNAACENGDAVLPPDNVPVIETSLANASEPGKGSVDAMADIGHAEDYERVPNNVIPEVAATKDADVLHESCVVNETTVSIVTPLENAEPEVTVDSIMNVMPDEAILTMVEDQQLQVETSEIMLSETAVQINNEVSTPSSHSDAVTAQDLHEPSEALKLDDALKPTADERDMTVSERKPSVQLEFEEKHQAINMVGITKADVKVEPMEIDTGSDRNLEVASKREESFEEDLQQQRSPSDAAHLKAEPELSNHGNVLKTEGEEIVSREPGHLREDSRDVVDLKPVEDGSQAHVHLKRSSEPKQHEPAKRMRRWNTGNQVAVDALKPLTSGTVKEIMLPESTDGSSAVASRVKAVATSRSLPPKVKVESEPTSNTRTVPPSIRTPSNSLKIDRFVRPFTLRAVNDLLAEFGQCTDFWMDQIKTHCFVSYSSVDEAVAARNGLYGRQWPPCVGNFLTAEYVDSHEVKIRSEGLIEKVEAAPAAASSQVPDPIRAPLRVGQSQSSFRSDSTTLLPTSRFSRGGEYPPAPPEPAVPTLEDLFFKTKAKPHIYYLPLTDEQVAKKINKPSSRAPL